MWSQSEVYFSRCMSKSRTFWGMTVADILLPRCWLAVSECKQTLLMMCSAVAGAIHSLACVPASIQIAGFDKSLAPICWNRRPPTQTKSSDVAERPRDCLSVVSFNNTIPRAQFFLLVTSASNLLIIKFCSVLLGLPSTDNNEAGVYCHQHISTTAVCLQHCTRLKWRFTDVLRFGVTVCRYKQRPTLTLGVINVLDGRNLLKTLDIPPVVNLKARYRKSQFLPQFLP